MPRANKGEKLTEAERHKRVVAMAKEVEPSENPKDFEKSFDEVTLKQADNPLSEPRKNRKAG